MRRRLGTRTLEGEEGVQKQTTPRTGSGQDGPAEGAPRARAVTAQVAVLAEDREERPRTTPIPQLERQASRALRSESTRTTEE